MPHPAARGYQKIVYLVGIKTVYDVKIMTHSTTYIAVYIEIVFKILLYQQILSCT